jgi:hypothetical protein
MSKLIPSDNQYLLTLHATAYYNEPRELVAVSIPYYPVSGCVFRGLTRIPQRTLFGIQTNIRDMVTSKWSEFQLASKRDMESGDGGANGDASWKKVVVAVILDGIQPADKAALEYVENPTISFWGIKLMAWF